MHKPLCRCTWYVFCFCALSLYVIACGLRRFLGFLCFWPAQNSNYIAKTSYRMQSGHNCYKVSFFFKTYPLGYYFLRTKFPNFAKCADMEKRIANKWICPLCQLWFFGRHRIAVSTLTLTMLTLNFNPKFYLCCAWQSHRKNLVKDPNDVSRCDNIVRHVQDCAEDLSSADSCSDDLEILVDAPPPSPPPLTELDTSEAAPAVPIIAPIITRPLPPADLTEIVRRKPLSENGDFLTFVKQSVGQNGLQSRSGTKCNTDSCSSDTKFCIAYMPGMSTSYTSPHHLLMQS